MKINNDFRTFAPDMNKPLESNPSQTAGTRSFGDAMSQHQSKLTQDMLSEQMTQINHQGDRLIKTMTVRELRKYKMMIKQFLEETIRKGVGLKDTKGWDRRGRNKKYKILDEIDEYLIAMGDEMIQSEAGRIQLLNQIGEIRGLLINLIF